MYRNAASYLSRPPSLITIGLAPRYCPAVLRRISQSYATKRGSPDYSEEDLASARKWLSNLNPDTIPRSICDITFSRSSGPGGQNVNKYASRLPTIPALTNPSPPPTPILISDDRVSSKSTLRLPLPLLLPLLPPILHHSIATSRYVAPKSSDIVIQADDSRKQTDNVNACFKKLHDLIVEAGRLTVPGETAEGQKEKVEKLQKAEAAGRRRMKEFRSGKKSARRGGGRGDD